MSNYNRLARKIELECEQSEKQTLRLVSKSLADKWNRISNMKAEELDELEKITNGQKNAKNMQKAIRNLLQAASGVLI